MEKKNKENSASLADLLDMFEDNISIADINASRYLGKISASIVKRRMELKMSQKEFAGYLGVSQGMVSRWEGGDYNFSIKALSEIAEKLELELYINLKPPVKKSKECYIEQKKEYIFARDDDKKFSKSNILQFNSKRNHLDNNTIKIINNFELQEMSREVNKMLQYVNGFSCAMDSEKDELIIKLLQRSPDFTDDNDGVIMDEVATIVMGKVTAQRLLEGLKEMLEDEVV